MRLFNLQLVFAFAGCLAAAAAVLDRVAVVVGNDVITEGEVNEEIRLEDFVASRPLDFSPAARREAASRLVDQQLIRQEIEVVRYKTPDAKQGDAMLANFRGQHFHTDSEFRAALTRYGITETQLKQYLLWQLTVIRFTDERFHPNIQEAADTSANRLATPPTAPPPHNTVPPPNPTSESHSADRVAGNAPVVPGGTVDEQLDAWLKQARGTTRITFKPEAFQ